MRMVIVVDGIIKSEQSRQDPEDQEELEILRMEMRRASEATAIASGYVNAEIREVTDEEYAELAAAIPIEPWQVKAEAERRIGILYPIWKQVNLIRAGGDELDAMTAHIDGIRAASNRIEALRPIPADFGEERYWSRARKSR